MNANNSVSESGGSAANGPAASSTNTSGEWDDVTRAAGAAPEGGQLQQQANNAQSSPAQAPPDPWQEAARAAHGMAYDERTARALTTGTVPFAPQHVPPPPLPYNSGVPSLASPVPAVPNSVGAGPILGNAQPEAAGNVGNQLMQCMMLQNKIQEDNQ